MNRRTLCEPRHRLRPIPCQIVVSKPNDAEATAAVAGGTLQRDPVQWVVEPHSLIETVSYTHLRAHETEADL
eukprot:3794045-Amphidinium_carterae.1